MNWGKDIDETYPDWLEQQTHPGPGFDASVDWRSIAKAVLALALGVAAAAVWLIK